MAEETKFSQEQVTPELSESDKIRKRVSEYKAQLSPNSLQVIEVMLNQQLAGGKIKAGDLDALILLRDDVNKASIDYRTQLEHAQRRLNELAETEMAEKVAAEEAAKQALVDSRDAERQRRKAVEDRLAQMEAVLASHGISMDLNQDGVVGLKDGQVADELTAEEQAKVDNMIQVEKDNVTTQPSRAFQMARAMNPEPSVSQQMQDELEPLHTEPSNGEIHRPLPDPMESWDGPLTHEPSVSDEQMAAANEMISELEEEEGFDANGSPTREVPRSIPQSETTKTFGQWDRETQLELKLREEVPNDAKGTEDFNAEVERVSQQADSAPVISNSQLPGDETTEYDESDDIEAAKRIETPTEDGGPDSEFVLSRQGVKMIADYPEEEEYEEITIPTESELKKMTKSAIAEHAGVLDFDIPTTLTKAKMIEKFMVEVETYITNLQESGEFVSATTEEDEDADTDNHKDGGYF